MAGTGGGVDGTVPSDPHGTSSTPKPAPGDAHGGSRAVTSQAQEMQRLGLIQGKRENQSQAAREGTRSLSAGFMALSRRAQSSARAARVPPQPTEKFLTY